MGGSRPCRPNGRICTGPFTSKSASMILDRPTSDLRPVVVRRPMEPDRLDVAASSRRAGRSAGFARHGRPGGCSASDGRRVVLGSADPMLTARQHCHIWESGNGTHRGCSDWLGCPNSDWLAPTCETLHGSLASSKRGESEVRRQLRSIWPTEPCSADFTPTPTSPPLLRPCPGRKGLCCRGNAPLLRPEQCLG